ncbi:endonuclease/exonuclease/phosphatase family metal-dependent hydrolase [Mangrovibacterium marinum]|uniref:Endonuclease/exonuclease/phosphatase family metal-dependent hydrolase n=1 Tax=Mangrovibacterium marinum TaxID=1639118 RepID=A0A2T5C169_9BACT|nr:endonuclease/exonuclease/phosphatase family metal-dependent hydrolase [Mangrovibacterium marinum]
MIGGCFGFSIFSNETQLNRSVLKRFFRNILLFFNIIAALTLLFIYLSVWVSPVVFWVPALVGLAYPYILLLNILFILYWLFAAPKWALVSIVCVGLGYTHLQNYFQFAPKESTDKGIVVCSYNVKAFAAKGYKYKDATQNAQTILDHLKTKKPDILCFQEMSFLNKKGYAGFNKQFDLKGLPTKADAGRVHGPVTLTKFPIIHKDEVHFEHTGNMIIITDVVTPSDTLRVFNCHLESYRFTQEDISSLDSISINKQDNNMKEFRLFGSKLKKAFIKRAEQAEELRRQIDASPYPVLVCGDFNDTPVSYTYHTVRGELKDAFVESGAGIGNTYLGRLPSFRIDYILHSPDFEAYNFQIDHVDFSDHYPVSCTLIPNKKD